jgi:hypothetical protein
MARSLGILRLQVKTSRSFPVSENRLMGKMIWAQTQMQEMLVTFQAQKYLYVAFTDCNTGKLRARFVLK